MEILKKSVVKSSIYYIWDNLFSVMKLSSIWGICILLCMFAVPYPIAAVTLYFFLLPLLTGCVYVSKVIIDKKKFFYRDLFTAVKKFYKRSLCFYFLFYLFSFILFASYFQYAKVKNIVNLSVFIMQSVFCITVFISQIYTLPLIVDKNMRYTEAFIESFKLFKDNVFYSIKSFFEMLIALTISFVGIITIPIFSSGIFGIFSMIIYYKIKRKNNCEEYEKS